MKYFVTISGETIEVDLRGPTPIVNGLEVSAHLVAVPGTQDRQLILGNSVHSITPEKGAKAGEWRIDFGSGPITAEAIDERSRAIRELAGASDAEAEMVVAAPMPGLVVRVNVAVGDEVQAGQGLVVVEAMKMENELKAPSAGTVESINAETGKAVEKGAVLVVLV